MDEDVTLGDPTEFRFEGMRISDGDDAHSIALWGREPSHRLLLSHLKDVCREETAPAEVLSEQAKILDPGLLCDCPPHRPGQAGSGERLSGSRSMFRTTDDDDL